MNPLFKLFPLTPVLLATAALATSGLCAAQDFGRVVSSTPVMQQVAVPRQVCTNEQVEVQQQKSGAGAVMGAIAGGAMGNAVGQGAGRAAATVLGVLGGAVVGDRVEGAPPSQIQTIQRCGTQTSYENRPVAYNVVYEFGGRQYSVQMQNDPGPSIPLQVTPVGANAPMAAPVNQVVVAPPVFVQPPMVVVAQPAYPVYYTRPYYPPVSLELGLGYWGGYRGHGSSHGHVRGHWR